MPERSNASQFKYQHQKEQIHNRSLRNQARAKVVKQRGESAAVGKDVGHRRGLISGGTNAPSNIRVESIHKNRGWQSPKKKR